MFILLDEIPQNSDQVKYATLIQIIKQKKKGNVRFVKLESDISEQLNGWKQFLDDSDPNGLMWYARLDHDINKIQSSGSSYVENLSSLVQKTELEFLDFLVDSPSPEMRTIGELKETLQGLIGTNSHVTLYDRYLLKFDSRILLDWHNTGEYNPKYIKNSVAANLNLILDPLSYFPPAEITIFSECFQKREYERLKKPGDPLWKDLVNQDNYKKLVRELFEKLTELVCEFYPSLQATELRLIDCSKNIHSKAALPHDRYMVVNRLYFVSSGGFKFSIDKWNSSDYHDFSSQDDSSFDEESIRPPSHLISVKHISEKNQPDSATIVYVRDSK